MKSDMTDTSKVKEWLQFDEKFVLRFWDRVAVEKETGCWNWTAYIDQGYGKVYNHDRVLRAHRVSWMLVIGEIPEGKQILHHCDNPRCVNPAHLFVGTAFDNMQDAFRKGRGKVPGLVGEQSGNAKLTNEQVVEIRRLYSVGEHTIAEIADMFPIKRAHTSAIIHGKKWKHLLPQES